jgi:hypothetical protein
METKKQSMERKQDIERELFDKLAIGRDLFDYHYTPLEYAYDVFIRCSNRKTNVMAEIKVRQDKDIAYFEKYGPYLELKKISGMMKAKKEYEDKFGKEIMMFYINFAKDGYQIFKLKNPSEYAFSERLLPKDNYEPHIKVKKQVAELYGSLETIRYVDNQIFKF